MRCEPCTPGTEYHRVKFRVRSAEVFRFLAANQQADGAWHPLWFGNQHRPDEANPVYGTAKVLLAYQELGRQADPAAVAGLSWLAGQQNADGGWGSGSAPGQPAPVEGGVLASSVEETALAVENCAIQRSQAGDATCCHERT